LSDLINIVLLPPILSRRLVRNLSDS